jgi:hypothetical protein
MKKKQNENHLPYHRELENAVREVSLYKRTGPENKHNQHG